MEINWIVAISLLIAAYCLIFYVRRVWFYSKRQKVLNDQISIVIAARNQDGIIEGITREFFDRCNLNQVTNLFLADIGSTDQTKIMMDRLGTQYSIIQVIRYNQGQTVEDIFKEVKERCETEVLYCIDMTVPVNFKLISKTLSSITGIEGVFLYRTKILQAKKERSL